MKSIFNHDLISLWFFSLLLILSNDISPNPGPEYPNSYFSFCNWNLNTISKNDFYRVSLLEAHNIHFNYDIISLCETSLQDNSSDIKNMLPGYVFLSANNPNGTKNGGVGIFYKESLPLRIRNDLSFDECLVCELNFGRKKYSFLFCTVTQQLKQTPLIFYYFVVTLKI